MGGRSRMLSAGASRRRGPPVHRPKPMPTRLEKTGSVRMVMSPTRRRMVAWPIQTAARSCLCQVFRLGFGGAEGRCKPSKKRNLPRPRPSQSATRKASGVRLAQSVIIRHFKCPNSQTFLKTSYAVNWAVQPEITHTGIRLRLTMPPYLNRLGGRDFQADGEVVAGVF